MSNEFDFELASDVLPDETKPQVSRDYLETLKLLTHVDVFSVLSNEQLSMLARESQVMTFGAGEFIVRLGQKGTALFVIKSGECEVFVDDIHYGKTVAVMGKGEFFGEMSLLTGDPAVATVRALKNSTLLAINKTLFSEIIKNHPELSEKLGEVLAERQENFARVTGRTLKNLPTSKTLMGRIKAFFKL